MSDINIKNKKAYFNYEILEELDCGIVLLGSEVKSIRAGKANIAESHCYIRNSECFIIGMHIAELLQAGRAGHDPYRTRKLLLTKKQIIKFDKELSIKGNTIVPVRLFFMNGKIKLKIGLARGKNNYDKRNSLREKDIKRDTDRILKL